MNFQSAAVAGGAAFVLSFLAGLLGGVSLLDMFIRALIWGAVGFGGCLGIETLLRNLLPDLFVIRDGSDEGPAGDEVPDRAVDITLGDEDSPRPGSFVEEVDEEEPEEALRTVPGRATPAPEVRGDGAPGPGTEVPSESSGVQTGDDEEMPEIGSFLDAFKPGAPDPEDSGGGRGPEPEYVDYAPVDQGSSSAGDRKVNGEVQDPVVLAKAVQTVMKRDGQGN